MTLHTVQYVIHNIHYHQRHKGFTKERYQEKFKENFPNLKDTDKDDEKAVDITEKELRELVSKYYLLR